MRVKLADFLNEHPVEEREDIERSLPSFKSVRSMYYRRMRESTRRKWEPRREGGTADPGDGEEQRQKPPNIFTICSLAPFSLRSGVPVWDFSWRQTLRGNPLLVVKGEDGLAREFCFSSKYGRPGAPLVKYYVCQGCRKERETNALPSVPLPRIKVLGDGKVFDMRNAPHLCSPLTTAQVVGKHFERDHRLSLPNCGARRAREAYEAMRANLTDFLNEHPAEEREDIERSLPSFKRVRSMYHRRMRGSGRRWAPYSEPTKPVTGAEAELASQDSSREQSDSPRTCEPCKKPTRAPNI
ncbi:unnamed protein product [Ixodes pacificus]